MRKVQIVGIEPATHVFSIKCVTDHPEHNRSLHKLLVKYVKDFNYDPEGIVRFLSRIILFFSLSRNIFLLP